MLAAISASHLSPLLSSFSLLYSNSSCVSVENSKLGPCEEEVSQSAGQTLPRSLCASHFTQPTHLHDSVNRAGFLAETTVDTLGHVNVIACSSAAAIRSWLSLNGDGLRDRPQVTVRLADPSWPWVCPSQLNLPPGRLHGCLMSSASK